MAPRNASAGGAALPEAAGLQSRQGAGCGSQGGGRAFAEAAALKGKAALEQLNRNLPPWSRMISSREEIGALKSRLQLLQDQEAA